MKNIKQTQAQPISVSHCTPVYINGRIKYWNIRVFYEGDLSTNTAQRTDVLKLVNKNPYLVWKFMDELQPFLKPDIIIPQKNRLTGLFRYNPEKDLSELEYSWRDGLFGYGAERAWQFRLKMLAQINKQKGLSK